jgi:hypothetical protein
VRTAKLCLLVLSSLSIVIFPAVALANNTTVNGVCIQQPTCGGPNVLEPGETAVGDIIGSFTFANGDTFGFLGAFDNAESSDGLNVSVSHYLNVFFVGNNGGPAVGNDLMDLQFVQGFDVNGKRGSFGYGESGSGAGTYGTNSTLQLFANMNGVSLGTSPLYRLPSFFDYRSGETEIDNIVNPLIFTEDIDINIGKGTLPGASLDIGTPEPASLVLLSTGLMGAFGGLKRKLKV